jgi:hypothetical protein
MPGSPASPGRRICPLRISPRMPVRRPVAPSPSNRAESQARPALGSGFPPSPPPAHQAPLFALLLSAPLRRTGSSDTALPHAPIQQLDPPVARPNRNEPSPCHRRLNPDRTPMALTDADPPARGATPCLGGSFSRVSRKSHGSHFSARLSSAVKRSAAPPRGPRPTLGSPGRPFRSVATPAAGHAGRSGPLIGDNESSPVGPTSAAPYRRKPPTPGPG